MEEDEKYWSNLEKIFVHNVYERISSKYDEFSQHGQKKNQNEAQNEENIRENCDDDYGIVNVKKNPKLTFKKNLKQKQNGILSRKKNEWPKVRLFLIHIEPYSLIADVGCGEGKYLNINSLIFPIGSDRSASLSQLACYRNASSSSMCNKNQIVICDNLSLPFRSNLFDAVISIGVIHHLSTSRRRILAIQELARILKPGGKIMIYVWAMEQRLRKFKSQDVLVPMLNLNSTSTEPRLKVNLRRDLSNNSAVNSEDSNDELVPERFSRTVSLNSQKNDSNQQEPDESPEKNSIPEDSQMLFDENSIKNESDESEPTKKTNFVDSLKRFFSQKVLSKEESDESSEKFSSLIFSKAKSLIEEPTSIQKYKKIIDEHKDLLPKNFTIRKFPHSSCQDTFENCEDTVDHKEKSDLSLSISSLSASSASPVNQCSPANNQTDGFIQSQSNDDPNDDDAEDRDNSLNKRFYHVFRKNELDNMVKQHCPELVIYESYYDHGNWSICARKEKLNPI
ncbi:putative tRNA methyltransferase 9 [Brachionus plicatilis]|uniref:Putative tRNA methyltransferase 9 n=1 Tax=Brachionus plicatilis TaxID=10195 RepID=A0A3M7STG4_BRAPC|nr:putative tRNA methyltransferase 9 [Brachionus plicatilis]